MIQQHGLPANHMTHHDETTRKTPHRTNRDGTIDAICPRCFATIGTSMWEAELERLEAAHVCDANRVEYFEDMDRDTATDGQLHGAHRPRGKSPKKTDS
jgi:hypothetical protein